MSNIKAWEGAIAVAGPEDDGRFGSHRYLTFVPVDDVATASFLCSIFCLQKGFTMLVKHLLEVPPESNVEFEKNA